MLSSAMYVNTPSARLAELDPISISTWSTIPVKVLLQSKQCTEEKNSSEVFYINEILCTKVKYCNVCGRSSKSGAQC